MGSLEAAWDAVEDSPPADEAGAALEDPDGAGAALLEDVVLPLHAVAVSSILAARTAVNAFFIL